MSECLVLCYGSYRTSRPQNFATSNSAQSHFRSLRWSRSSSDAYSSQSETICRNHVHNVGAGEETAEQSISFSTSPLSSSTTHILSTPRHNLVLPPSCHRYDQPTQAPNEARPWTLSLIILPCYYAKWITLQQGTLRQRASNFSCGLGARSVFDCPMRETETSFKTSRVETLL